MKNVALIAFIFPLGYLGFLALNIISDISAIEESLSSEKELKKSFVRLLIFGAALFLYFVFHFGSDIDKFSNWLNK